MTDAVGRELVGRVALVTGAASGIGRATSIELAARGAAVGCLDRDVDRVHETVRTIEARGGRSIALGADVTDASEVDAAVARLAAALGAAGIVVNNAGLPGSGTFADVTLEGWQRVIDSHVLGSFLVTKATLPGMVAAGWGRIVFLASDGLWLGNTSVEYATAKAALLGFTRALARQVAAQGVNVNAVAPGPVDTPMLGVGTPDEIEAERRSVLIGRVMRPEEIAATIGFLVGPGGDPYVGQVLSPNGGTVFPG